MGRILLISTSYPSRQSTGAEAAGSFVADFAEELARHVNVSVVAPGTVDSREDRSSLTVHRFACDRLPLSLLSPLNPRDWRAILSVLRRGGQLVKRVAAETKFDHVFALWALPSGYWARRLWRESGVPYSVWTLGSDVWTLGKIPVIRSLLRVVLRDAANCFSDGLVLRDDTAQIAGGRSCHFLPSVRNLPVQAREIRGPNGKTRLAFLGRWHRNKGIDLLLDALDHLDDTQWSRIEEIRICGGGPLEWLVRHRCELHARSSRPVSVCGFLGKTEAAALLAWTDYLVIPSRIESIPVVFSDAIQAGCPLLATPVGDLRRLIEQYGVGIVANSVSAAEIKTLIQLATTRPAAEFWPSLENARRDFSVTGACRAFLDYITAFATPGQSQDSSLVTMQVGAARFPKQPDITG